MRLLSLELEKYGVFAGQTLSFRRDARAHVVYGPNEAGKSTALSAVTDLLFEIRDMRHAFRHKASDLRIRGEILARDGRSLRFARRKGNKATLLDASGVALADDALAPYLGGLTREVFIRAFGLDARALRDGAGALLASGGEVGESLMAAAAGLRGLSELRRELEVEADRIFAPRKSADRAFYQALARHEDARKAIAEKELRATDWRRLVDALEASARRLDEIRSARPAIARRRARLERLARLRPLVRIIDEKAAAHAALESLGVLPRGFGLQLGEALDASASAEASRAEAVEDAAAAAAELEAIHVDRALLARAAEVERLTAGLQLYAQQSEHHPKIRDQADVVRSSALDVAARLGLADFDDLGERRPTDAALAEVRAGIRRHEDFERQRRGYEEALAKESDAIRDHERQRAARGALRDPALWREKLAALGDVPARAAERDRDATRLASDETLLREDAARQSPPVGDLDALARTALPSKDENGRFKRDFDKQEAGARDARGEIARNEDAIAATQARLRDLVADGQVPTPDIVAAARATREAIWAALRAALLGEAEGASSATLTGDVARFERAILEADRLADAAARDAERVAGHAAATRELQRLRDVERAAGERLASVERDMNELRARWQAAWRAAGVEPLPPNDMATWLVAVDELLRRRNDIVERGGALRQIESALSGRAAPLAALAAEARLQDMPGLDIGSQFVRVEKRVRQVEEAWNDARADDALHRAAIERRDKLGANVDTLEAARVAWLPTWSGSLSALGLADTASREAAGAALDAWNEAPELLRAHADLRRRVNGMRRDMDEFEQRARDLASDISPDLVACSPMEIARALGQRLTSAQRDAVRHEAADRGRKASDTLADASGRRLEAARANLEALATQAPVGADLAALRVALTARDDARDALENARAHFTQAADGHGEADIRADLASFDPDSATADLDDLAREEDLLNDESNRVFADHRAHEARREALEQGAGAELATLQRLGAEEDLRNLARDWARLKIASLLLDSALERQRATRKDPLLRRAGALFSVMTGGNYTGIEQIYDDADTARLAALRRDGDMIPLGDLAGKDRGGLSEGTADQLFLALRLAFVEDYASRAEPSPFIGDDLLASFDDTRAGLAFQALGQLGERTQVIVFTHHRHVVDIAARVLGDGVDLIELG